MSIEIPQDFLDNGIYPILIDPTFGYTTAGASYAECINYIRGSVFTGAINDGNEVDFYAYNEVYSDQYYFSPTIYKSSDSSLVGGNNNGRGSLTASWKLLTYWNSFSLSAIDYILVVWGEYSGKGSYANLYYDTGATNQGKSQSLTYTGTFPDPATFTSDTNKYSIYVTYTAGGGTAYTKALSEVITIVDTKAIQTQRIFSEVVIIVDTVSNQVGRTLSEIITIIDKIGKASCSELG